MSEDEMKNDKGEEKCIGDGPPAQLFQSFYQNINHADNLASLEIKIYIIMDL